MNHLHNYITFHNAPYWWMRNIVGYWSSISKYGRTSAMKISFITSCMQTQAHHGPKKWPLFHKQCFQMHFCERKCAYFHQNFILVSPHILKNQSYNEVIATCHIINSWRPRLNRRHFADEFFKCIFFNKMFKFRLRFHWSLFPRVQLIIFQHWFR